MSCARWNCVYAISIGFLICTQSVAAFGKDGKEGKSLSIENNSPVTSREDQFQWQEHNKLSWDDFRGAVNAVSDESAAATHCGIGFRTNSGAAGNKAQVVVYNTFYANKSWVRPDAKISTILDHEQGHFDLCEIYTRKLRERMSNFDFNVADVKQQLLGIYAEINNEYESRQQAYEHETIHGTNIAEQKRWCAMITSELNVASGISQVSADIYALHQ